MVSLHFHIVDKHSLCPSPVWVVKSISAIMILLRDNGTLNVYIALHSNDNVLLIQYIVCTVQWRRTDCIFGNDLCLVDFTLLDPSDWQIHITLRLLVLVCLVCQNYVNCTHGICMCSWNGGVETLMCVQIIYATYRWIHFTYQWQSCFFS